MKVFISWSRERSKVVAEALRQWLPDVIQSVEPWLSSQDIEAGARWGDEVARELTETSFGIVCLTAENQTAPWILFEAGALAKTLDKSRVVPYLIGLEPTDVQRGPLAQFQGKRANKTETWGLVRTINRTLEHPLQDDQIKRTFERWWPDLDEKLKQLPELEQNQESKRSTDDMIEEILELVRQMSRELDDRRYVAHISQHKGESNINDLSISRELLKRSISAALGESTIRNAEQFLKEQ